MPLKTVQQDTLSNKSSKSLMDTIVQKDTNSLFQTLKSPVKEDAFIKKINQDYDATGYYYVNSTKEVPVTPYFLNPEIFSVSKQTKQEVDTVSSSSKSADNFTLKQSDVLLFVLLILASLIAYVRIKTHEYIRKISISVFSFPYSRTLFNEHTKLFLIYDFLLLTVYYLTSGILIQMLLFYYGYGDSAIPGFKLIIYTSGFVFAVLLSYQILVRFLGEISNTRNIVSEYLFYLNNSLKFSGIFNLIVVFILLYSSENFGIFLIYLTFFLYLTLYVIRVYKIFFDFLRNQFSLFYFILYFCALEIIPVMILLKHFSIF